METKTYLICFNLMILFISAMAFDVEEEPTIIPQYHGIRAERGAIKNALKGAVGGAIAGKIAHAVTGHGSAKKGAALGAVANTAKHALSGKHH